MKPSEHDIALEQYAGPDPETVSEAARESQEIISRLMLFLLKGDRVNALTAGRRVLAIAHILKTEGTPRSISELAVKMNASKSTVYEILEEAKREISGHSSA